MNIFLAVFIGGGLGSIARFSISKLVNSSFQNINPIGTLTANLISTLILGVIVYYISSKYSLNDSLKALLIVGFCGGFSTFSTFSFEIFELIKSGNLLYAILNALLSVSLGVFILYLISKSIG